MIYNTKPFLDIAWKIMIDRVLESLDISGRIILILSWNTIDNSKEIQSYIEKLKNKYKDIIFIKSYKKLEWAAKSCLQAEEVLEKQWELIVAYCDQIFDYNSSDFLNFARVNNYDWVITTYDNWGQDKDDFLLCDKNRNVLELVPKKVISDIATTWMYYWKNSRNFIEWAHSMISKNIRYNNEYYVWPIYNENILKWWKIWYFNINIHQVWNPNDYKKYIDFLQAK